MTPAVLDAIHTAQCRLAEERAAVIRCDELGLTGLDRQTAEREVLHYRALLRRLIGPSGFLTEFGDSAIGMPGAVLDLLDAGDLLDTSWHNDAAPSFIAAAQKDAENADGFVRLWVHPADPTDREWPESARYCVTVPDADGNAESVLETDDLVEALAVFWQRVPDPTKGT